MELGVSIKPIGIEDEMKRSYLDYAMSVIVSRALPDVRDGLKPVHRRILYAMSELNLRYNTPYKKSARIVGEVLGKYHPHGDTSVYDAMVRLAQDFSMRYKLVDGQGNFGSVDDDPPAAMRYTEARLARIAEEMLVDIDKDTVDFVPNFDDSLKEPSVLPARLPNLLVNGSSGIAVGMATNIPPHNLTEVCDAINYLIDNPEATAEDLMQFVKGPDFPTAGIICGVEGIKSAYATGQGKVVLRARVVEENTKGGKAQLVITELPYQTNKAELVRKIADLARDKRLEGVSDVRDESDRQGMRVVIGLRKDAHPAKVQNNLFKNTVMQTAFFINMIALIDGQPKVINLKEALQCYVEFRQVVITRRTRYDLQKAKERAHILEGFKIALDHLDAVIKTIRESETAEAARGNLMTEFTLTQLQAQAILDMQLRRLANLERKKIIDEYKDILKTISQLEDLLANPAKMLKLIQKDVLELKTKYGDARRTVISGEEVGQFQVQDLIPHQDVIVTLSEQGYIKRIPADVFRKQLRGGRGVKGMVTRESDDVMSSLAADTHDNLLFFTNRGRVFKMKCYEIQADLSRTTKGINIVNLIPVEAREKVTAMFVPEKTDPGLFMLLATSKGIVKKTSMDHFQEVRRNGLIAMKLKTEEELIGVDVVSQSDKIMLVSRNGQAVKFAVEPLRNASRTSGGVRGIKLNKGDIVVSMGTVRTGCDLITVTENGYGKRTRVDKFPLHGRGGKGVLAHRVNAKTGNVIAAKFVPHGYELFITTAKGIQLRINIDVQQETREVEEGGKKKRREGVPVKGRITQGVMLSRLDEDDRVVSIAIVEKETPEETEAKQTKAIAKPPVKAIVPEQPQLPFAA
ncbi:MAG: DNA gyrase subunit A [Dehalococcoidia bacterium]|nr:DNA gyrase subunit A [Dehalococcoidia bacterium]MDD5493581.1 DNA gyrase subunit A [Dehalococcoidia bacterium]